MAPKEMIAGFYEKLGTRTDHLKANKYGKLANVKYFC